MRLAVAAAVACAAFVAACSSPSSPTLPSSTSPVGVSQSASGHVSGQAIVQASAATSWTFNLIGPNTAEAASGPFRGDTLQITGSGAFTAGTSIAGDGSFTHIKSDGTVFARGIWRATSFTSFTPFGGPREGTQGGQLRLTVTLFPDGGSPVPGIPMSVTCLVNAPSGFTDEEGTTIGAFTEKTGGTTLFHMIS